MTLNAMSLIVSASPVSRSMFSVVRRTSPKKATCERGTVRGRISARSISGLNMRMAPSMLSASIVRILKRGGGTISVTPLERQPEPMGLIALKGEVGRCWPMTSLLDMLKEADLRIGFTDVFRTVTDHENLPRSVLQQRLLLCLNGMGTNAGLKRMASGQQGITYKDLLYVRRRFINRDVLREAIAAVVNATLRARHPGIWGEGTTACAADSKQFGAWDQNLMTEWHARYGGRSVMIYWHVERRSTCIYSQLKTCSSSEAAMIEGVLCHCTDMEVDRTYVDSHGQSEVAFSFCRLLGFQLLPRLKGIPPPAPVSSHHRSAGRLPGPAACPHAPDRLGADRAPVRPNCEVRHRTPARHRGHRRHPAPLHPRQLAASDLQGPGRAWEGAAHDVRLPLPEQPGTPARDPRGPERSRELEFGQRLHPLRPRRRDRHQPSGRSGSDHAVSAPAAELHDLREHADVPACAQRADLGYPHGTGRAARDDAAGLGARQPIRDVPPRHDHSPAAGYALAGCRLTTAFPSGSFPF